MIWSSTILQVLAFDGSSQKESHIRFSKFAGTYVTGHEFGGSSLKLEADGRFSTGSYSDDGTEISTSGNYILSEGVLRFIITKQVGKRRRDERELNLLDPQDRKEMFGDSDAGDIEREFKKLPIEWSGRIYLIREEDLKVFANAINLGLEPRSTLRSERFSSPWYGSFYLRSGDEQKKVTGNPALPEKWLSFLLSKPVSATIISIQESKKEKYTTIITATINKGSRDGLRVGMRLLSKDEEPSPWDGPEVTSVEEKTAKIRAVLVNSELKTGDVLRTRYEPKEGYR